MTRLRQASAWQANDEENLNDETQITAQALPFRVS
jgi:hypothetical protein